MGGNGGGMEWRDGGEAQHSPSPIKDGGGMGGGGHPWMGWYQYTM